MEHLFENYKGVVLFYFVVALLAILFVCRINIVNSVGSSTNVNETRMTYHA